MSHRVQKAQAAKRERRAATHGTPKEMKAIARSMGIGVYAGRVTHSKETAGCHVCNAPCKYAKEKR
jgi:hypothetical protein